MVKIIYFPFLIYLTLSSCTKECSNKTHSEDPELVGRILSVIVDHVVEKRDWCRNTKITFNMEIENISCDSISIDNLVSEVNFCSLKTNSPFFFLLLKTDSVEQNNPSIRPKMFLSGIDAGRVATKIPPRTKIRFECYLLDDIKGGNLIEIDSTFHNILYSNFSIVTLQKSDVKLKNIDFNLSKEFMVVYKLDDKIVYPEDVTSFKRKLPDPPIVFPK